MASIVILMMGSVEAEKHRPELVALRAAGHALSVVEPRWPDCQAALRELSPALVVVDGGRAPSHGRAAAAWFSGQPRLRTVPFLFADVPDRDVARVKKEVPRAQFGTWAAVLGASERLVK